MKKYLIEKNGVVVTFGLNEINAKNQYGNLNNLKEYQKVAVPQFDKRLYSCREITPLLVDGVYKQQWELFNLQLNTSKTNVIKDLSEQTTNGIFKSYDSVKQSSDTNDKEYWGAWLISHFPTTYTIDNIYSKIFASASKVFAGAATLTSELKTLQAVTTFADAEEEGKYPIAIEQLLKVAIRQGWVQACKYEYTSKVAQINNATTIDELSAITLSLPVYPL